VRDRDRTLRLHAIRLTTRLYPFLPWVLRIPSLFGARDAIPPDDSSVIDTHGIRVRLRADPMWGSLWRQRLYEPFATKVFRRIVSRGDVVLDVGTNFGWFAALFANWIGPEGHVHAFEPVASIADIAAETLELSDVAAHVTLNCLGLGATEGTFRVFTFAGLPLGHASACDLGRNDAQPHECTVTTLDTYAERNGLTQVTFMKLDVEGHELDVLRGGRTFLSSPDAPVIYFETNTECLDHRGIRAQELIDLLREFGYSDFYTFSIRHGFRKRSSLPDNAHGDHLAFKDAHRVIKTRVLSTRRLLR
jgi:FkbM family methyltransferase